MKTTLFALLYFASILSIAQNPPGEEYLIKGRQYESENQRDSAIYYFDKAAAYFQKQEQWNKYIESVAGYNDNMLKSGKIDVEAKSLEVFQIVETHNLNPHNPFFVKIHSHLGRFYWFAKSDIPQALHYLKKGEKLYEEGNLDQMPILITIYTNYGFSYGYSGDFDLSEKYFQQALDLSIEEYGSSAEVIADRYTDLVFPLIQKTEWEKAEAELKKALELNLKNRGPEHLNVMKNYSNLGYIYLEQFDSEQAILYINKALNLLKKNFGEDHRSVGIAYMNLGASYGNKSEYQTSINYSRKGLDNLTRTIGPQNQYNSVILNNLAINFSKLNQYDSAEHYFIRSIELKESLYGKKHPFLVQSYIAMAEFYLDHEDLNEAYDALGFAKEIAEEVLPEKHRFLAETYYLLAEYHFKSKNLMEAANVNRQALAALVPGYSLNALDQNPNLDEVLSYRVMVDALMQKTEIFQSLYQNEKDVSFLNIAYKTAEKADRAIDILRVTYQTPDSKELLLGKVQGFYESAIEIAYLLHDQTNDQSYVEAAFHYFEKSKSVLLLENIKSVQAVNYRDIPDSISTQETALKRNISSYNEKMLEARVKNDTVGLEEARDKYFEKKRDYDILLEKIKKEYPAYFNVKHDINTVPLSTVQAELNAKDIMITYFYGKDNIYVLAIRKKEVQKKIIKTPEIYENIISLIQGMKNGKSEGRNSMAIYSDLVEPFLAGDDSISNITFIPGGILYYLPFESLVIADKDRNKYLIEDYTVNYLLSASLSGYYNNDEKRQSNYIGFAPGYEQETNSLLTSRSAENKALASELSKLPMAEQEIQFSSKIWGGKYYTQNQATEGNFKRIISDAGIIHIASHAVLNDEDPMYSKLIFSNEEDSTEDGLLHTYELYNLKMNAQLACLSACNTGLGKIKSGEGVSNMARGFMYAGVPNVVVSLWSVPDHSTSEIITDFYKELSKGKGKAEALRSAKLKYLESADENLRSPYFWAALTLIGDNEPIVREEEKLPWKAITVAIILICAAVWMGLKLKRSASQ